MNIEFVQLILTGVCNFMEIRQIKMAMQTGQDVNNIIKKTNELEVHFQKDVTNITYCDIKVQELEKWNIMHRSASQR
jgi:3'-phosphoadenosine 5'-phosphosulfate (PAPS) 3'-phosphatase